MSHYPIDESIFGLTDEQRSVGFDFYSQTEQSSDHFDFSCERRYSILHRRSSRPMLRRSTRAMSSSERKRLHKIEHQNEYRLIRFQRFKGVLEETGRPRRARNHCQVRVWRDRWQLPGPRGHHGGAVEVSAPQQPFSPTLTGFILDQSVWKHSSLVRSPFESLRESDSPERNGRTEAEVLAEGKRFSQNAQTIIYK